MLANADKCLGRSSVNLSHEQPAMPDGSASQGGPIGRVLSCRGSEARIGLTDAQPLGDHRATVGKFIAIRSGGNLLLGIIAEVSAANEQSAGPGCRAVARVDLMGEITHGPGAPRFRRG